MQEVSERVDVAFSVGGDVTFPECSSTSDANSAARWDAPDLIGIGGRPPGAPVAGVGMHQPGTSSAL